MSKKNEIRCPKCGSNMVEKDGVRQRSKGFLYYITGTNIRDAGYRHAAKLANAVKDNKLNAKCLSCGYEWSTKEVAASAYSGPADSAPKNPPAPGPRGRFCPKCGTEAEEGDLFCIQCGSKLRT